MFYFTKKLNNLLTKKIKNAKTHNSKIKKILLKMLKGRQISVGKEKDQVEQLQIQRHQFQIRKDHQDQTFH